MIDGTQIFIEFMIAKLQKKYSLYAIKHSYFFIIGILKLN